VSRALIVSTTFVESTFVESVGVLEPVPLEQAAKSPTTINAKNTFFINFNFNFFLFSIYIKNADLF
jgi:hypothetical protein